MSLTLSTPEQCVQRPFNCMLYELESRKCRHLEYNCVICDTLMHFTLNWKENCVSKVSDDSHFNRVTECTTTESKLPFHPFHQESTFVFVFVVSGLLRVVDSKLN